MPSDLSPDGVHPGTLGYDKMARVWYAALTGQTPPPLPADGTTQFGAGTIWEQKTSSVPQIQSLFPIRLPALRFRAVSW